MNRSNIKHSIFHIFHISLVAALLIAIPLSAQQPTGREIMEMFKAQERTKDTSVEFKMTIINARGSQREREVTQVTKTDENDNRKQLIRFLSPADVAGTGFLSIEYSDRNDDNWLYLPALRKTRRIAGSDKTDSFIGTEFTYEDLDTETLDAYEYRLTGSANIDGIESWVIEAIATDFKKIKETGYSKRELWISKDHHLVIQTKFYDKDGAYVKLFKTSDIRQVPGTDKWRPFYLSMEEVRKGDRTVLSMTDYKINQGVEDQFFSERYLKRGR